MTVIYACGGRRALRRGLYCVYINMRARGAHRHLLISLQGEVRHRARRVVLLKTVVVALWLAERSRLASPLALRSALASRLQAHRCLSVTGRGQPGTGDRIRRKLCSVAAWFSTSCGVLNSVRFSLSPCDLEHFREIVNAAGTMDHVEVIH